ncbi:OmpA family protein [Hymenobacter sp.]|jgi:outer membrane protein OmpA-like peptidoglycan-associated protein|uniref:OmpA family protein n=1 Tax=Hymenobacter sp. TaxID=1898978 RepID=UPI002ED78500
MKQFLLILRGLILPLVLLGSQPATHAQTAERRTSLGLTGSALQYEGNFGSNYWKFDNNEYAPGLAINQYLTRGLDLNSQVIYGQLMGRRSANTYFNTTLININAGFKLKLNNGWALKEEARLQPYLLAASGWTYASRTGQIDGTRMDEDKGYLDVQAGAGINLRLGRGVSFSVQSTQHTPLRANLDGSTELSTPRWSDRFLQHTVGLTINLGQGPDFDEDGVADRLDHCPSTPNGLEVDEHGCAFDDDQDGVPNYLDQCPGQTGTAELHGCPDTDNDGVDNSDDACPEKPGKPELHGCPDTDNDGVADEEDTCPDTPAGSTVNATGCPIAPPPPAPAATSPTDTDGDGVLNTDDRCPDRAGPAANRGCPEIKAESRQRLAEATRLIGFERNQATLLPTSYPTLDAIAELLKEYPDYSLSVAGHTDSQGPAAFNQRLARERAAAARHYLLNRGLTESRIEWLGYGATQPVTTNSTDAGRAQNRRVEFDLFLTGDPNAAQVKYGPEPTIPKTAAPAKKKAVKKKGGAKTVVRKKRPTTKKKSGGTARRTSRPSAKPKR